MSEAIRTTDQSESDTGTVEAQGSSEETASDASGETGASGDAGTSTRDARGPRASDATRQTIAELGDRARAVVEELARHARERREAAAARAAEPSAAAPSSRHTADEAVAVLPQRLGEIRAHMGEIADVLEAAIERLETVEHQLGDPDESIERQLSEGIARCERMLMGIEHRVDAGAPKDRQPALVAREAGSRAWSGGPVLVVSCSSRRRAGLCVALEHQGLPVVAAHDLASALRVASRTSPSAALLDLEGSTGSRVATLEEWKDLEDRGALPRAAAIGTGESEALRHGFEAVREEHGAAAMAAVLARLVPGETDGSADSGTTP